MKRHGGLNSAVVGPGMWFVSGMSYCTYSLSKCLSTTHDVSVMLVRRLVLLLSTQAVRRERSTSRVACAVLFDHRGADRIKPRDERAESEQLGALATGRTQG